MPKLTLKQAVNQNCKDCCYDPEAGGNWRQQVEACTVTKCALWEHRPLTATTRKANAPEPTEEEKERRRIAGERLKLAHLQRSL